MGDTEELPLVGNRISNVERGGAHAQNVAAPGRIIAFDTLRGLFMTLIAAVHLLPNVDPTILGPFTIECLRATLLGTVGFMTVSGLLVGYQLERRPGQAGRIIARYRRHALMLLIVAHPLILLGIYGWKRAGGSPRDLVVRTWFITDTLAVIFFAVVPFVARLQSRARLGLGVALMLAGRLAYVLPRAGSGPALLLVDILAGADRRGHHLLYEDYPLLSMAGMFLVGSWLGRSFYFAEQLGDLLSFARKCVRAIPWLLLATGILLAAWWALRRGPQGALRALLYPDCYLSTYPVYLAAFLGLMGRLCTRRRPSPADSFFAVLGRTSLFTYVAQYYLMQAIPLLAGWRHHMSLPVLIAYFAGALVVLTMLARAYERVWYGRGRAALGGAVAG